MWLVSGIWDMDMNIPFESVIKTQKLRLDRRIGTLGLLHGTGTLGLLHGTGTLGLLHGTLQSTGHDKAVYLNFSEGT